MKNLYFDSYISLGMFAGCWGCIQCGGIIFSLFLPSGVSWWGFPQLCALSAREPGKSLSWSPGGELGVGVGAAVGFLGVGVMRYVFVLDMVLVTCEL